MLSAVTRKRIKRQNSRKIQGSYGEIACKTILFGGCLVTSSSVLVVTVTCTNRALSFPEDAWLCRDFVFYCDVQVFQ